MVQSPSFGRAELKGRAWTRWRLYGGEPAEVPALVMLCPAIGHFKVGGYAANFLILRYAAKMSLRFFFGVHPNVSRNSFESMITGYLK